MNERTLSIVKPDAVAKAKVGDIIARFEAAGLRMVAGRFMRLSLADARRFYHVHQGKGFFASLTEFMSSGPIFASVWEGEGAIARVREIMGPTDPARAEPGSIRHDVGSDIERNAAHGSDAADTARWEIGFFFGELDQQVY